MRYFDGIDVCEVERGISDLTLNAHEEHGMLGPVIGCLVGCARLIAPLPFESGGVVGLERLAKLVVLAKLVFLALVVFLTLYLSCEPQIPN